MDRESQVILYCAKLNPGETDISFIKENINYDIDWGKLFYLCIHHKVTPLVYNTLETLDLLEYMEYSLRRIMETECERIRSFNNEMYEQVYIINNALLKNSIRAAIIKGVMLGLVVYANPALRQYADVDYLVNGKDITAVEQVLSDLGYVSGKYNPTEDKIELTSRAEKLNRRLHTHEIGEYIKQVNNTYITVDVNFEIFWKGAKKSVSYVLPTSKLLDDAEKIQFGESMVYCLTPEYQLIQLCGHLYSEATLFCWKPTWERDKPDIQLIRFCDIYELIGRYHVDWDKVKEITTINNIQEPVYYTLKMLNILYPQTVPDDFITQLSTDDSIINRYYDKDGNDHYWKMDVLSRMFNIPDKYIEIHNERIFI